jgi:hypothetical protein
VFAKADANTENVELQKTKDKANEKGIKAAVEKTTKAYGEETRILVLCIGRTPERWREEG